MKESDFTNGFPGELTRIAGGHLAFVPAGLPGAIEIDSEIQLLHEKCMLSLGALGQIVPFLPNPRLITSPFLRREAVLSSRIEGTRTDLGQLYLYEATDASSKRHETPESRDAREVSNYVKALYHGLDLIKELPVCGRVLRKMHEVLMDGVTDERGANKQPGEFRIGQAFIGTSNDISDARYVAPPPDRIERLFLDLESFANHASPLPTLVWIAMIHYQFEAIHPFADGNGRIGRLLISLLLAERRILAEPLLYLSAHFERHREQYNQGLWKISAAAEWHAWVVFFLEGVHQESSDATRRALSLMKLRESFRTLLQERRGKVLELVDALFITPVVTVPGVQQLLSMTYRGAQKNIDTLVEIGLLEQLPVTYKKIYVASPVISTIDANDSPEN
jgi:Fic family protein